MLSCVVTEHYCIQCVDCVCMIWCLVNFFMIYLSVWIPPPKTPCCMLSNTGEDVSCVKWKCMKIKKEHIITQKKKIQSCENEALLNKSAVEWNCRCWRFNLFIYFVIQTLFTSRARAPRKRTTESLSSATPTSRMDHISAHAMNIPIAMEGNALFWRNVDELNLTLLFLTGIFCLYC